MAPHSAKHYKHFGVFFRPGMTNWKIMLFILLMLSAVFLCYLDSTEIWNVPKLKSIYIVGTTSFSFSAKHDNATTINHTDFRFETCNVGSECYRFSQLPQPRLWFITGGYLVKRWFIPAAARARGQSNDLNREILVPNLFNCHK